MLTLQAGLLGILVPLCSNVGPMRQAIATSLRDALDTYRRKKVDDFSV